MEPIILLKVLIAVFFGVAIVERLTRMFGDRRNEVARPSVGEKSSSLIMITIYAGIVLDGFFHFLRISNPSWFLSLIGIVVYIFAAKCRNLTIRFFGTEWNIHTSASGISHLLKVGPFKYSRHPYYMATLLELLGYSVLFQSWRTAILTTLVFLPLILIIRIKVEESKLIAKFGPAYCNYQKNVPCLFPASSFLSKSNIIQKAFQVLDIAKRFGIAQLFKIKFMSSVISNYSRGYAVSSLSGALIELGVIQAIKEKGIVELTTFARDKKYDFNSLSSACDYFAILGIFEKKGFFYKFSQYGEKLFNEGQGALMLLYAYMPIFENFPAIIRKEKYYGRDIFRRSEFVGRGSCELSALLPFPYAKDMLRRHSLHKIIDLGCGSGDFLIYFCKEEEFSGVGIDLSREVIEIATEIAKKEKIDSRVRFCVGDILALDRLECQCKEADVITFMFVIHEFLAKGREKVIEIFKKISTIFPDKAILLCEVYRKTTPELIKSPSTVAEHHLFHRLSQQGLATLDEWHEIFNDAGLRCIEERRLDQAGQAYFLLKRYNSA